MRRKSWDDDEEQKRTPCLALFSVSLVTFICLNVIGSVSNQIFPKIFEIGIDWGFSKISFYTNYNMINMDEYSKKFP